MGVKLWHAAFPPETRFLRLWEIASGPLPRDFDELISRFPDQAELLRAMRYAGVVFEGPARRAGYVRLAASNAAVARQFGLSDSSEFDGE